MPIDPVTSLPALAKTGLPAAAAPAAASGQGFSESLQSMLGAVNDSSSAANSAIGKMLEGTGDVHEAVIAMQRADVMMQLTVQVRNKLVQAYQDVMRMPM